MNQEQRLPSCTLQFRQAMKDFTAMFPSLEKGVVECVLRSNSGHVDTTIDHLLQITQDCILSKSSIKKSFHSSERLFHAYEQSKSSGDEISLQLQSHLQDDCRQLPKYTQTPQYHPPFAYMFSTDSIDAFTTRNIEPKISKEFRDWNPPLLGPFPSDFLRIVPTRSICHSKFSSTSQVQPRGLYHAAAHRNVLSPSCKSVPHKKNIKTSPCFNKRHLGQGRKSAGDSHMVVPQKLNNDASLQSSQRNNEKQSIEDRKVALLLQNEEFLRELRKNEEFLRKLNKETCLCKCRSRGTSSLQTPITVGPAQQTPSLFSRSYALDSNYSNNPEDQEFKESLKHMNKSAKKSFNALARRFYSKRKSYKSIHDKVEPIFANCEY